MEMPRVRVVRTGVQLPSPPLLDLSRGGEVGVGKVEAGLRTGSPIFADVRQGSDILKFASNWRELTFDEEGGRGIMARSLFGIQVPPSS